MKTMRAGVPALVLFAAMAASWDAAGAVTDGTDCGGFTAADAATWLKAPAAQVERQVSKAGDGRWTCSFQAGKSPAIAFSVAVSSSAKRAADDLERYRDELAQAGEGAAWKGKLPNGVYADMFGCGDEGVWTDINGTYTVRRDNVTVQITLPKEKEEQRRLAQAVVQKF